MRQKNLGNRNIERKIKTPEDVKELRDQLKNIEEINNKYVITSEADLKKHKDSYFEKIKTFFNRKEK